MELLPDPHTAEGRKAWRIEGDTLHVTLRGAVYAMLAHGEASLQRDAASAITALTCDVISEDDPIDSLRTYGSPLRCITLHDASAQSRGFAGASYTFPAGDLDD